MTENYCIKKNYVANSENLTIENETNVFWTAERFKNSGLYQWHVYHYIRSIVKKYNIKNVLDIGCGGGVKLVKMLSDIVEIYGIDQPSAVEYCKKTYSIGNFFSDNFENPTIELNIAFGLIICSDVIEHMVNPNILLDYIKRFCNKGTLVIFSTPDRDLLRGKACLHSEKKEHIREWNAEEFREYIEKNGFKILEHRHVAPVKTALNILFLKHVIRQTLLNRRPYRYNHIVLCLLR